MEEERIDDMNVQEEPKEEQPEVYVERPGWQVWLARIGFVIFILIVLYQIFYLATGGKYANPWN